MITKEEIYSLIAKGEIERVFAELLSSDSLNPREIESLVLLSARYNSIRESSIRGILSRDEYAISLANINNDVINLFNQLRFNVVRVDETKRMEFFLADLYNRDSLITSWRSNRNVSQIIGNLTSVPRLDSAPDTISREAILVKRIVPDRIIDQFKERIDKCWDRYSEILVSTEFMPSEIDDATDAVVRCICRELKRLFKVNRRIPDGILKIMWLKYSCDNE